MKYQLQHFDSEQFLTEFWQKKPCLIRQGFKQFIDPLSPDELAGLSLEEEVESRIIQGSDKHQNWQLDHGPFDEDKFSSLPKQDWTLLVQAVDHWVPEVRSLLEAFRFIPDWRLDDIMVSYAVPGGTVGAHYDQYDVFLIQGSGRREWQLGQHCTEHSPIRPHPQLRLLAEFECKERHILEPGDILYIPPGIAHHGISLEDSMTFSVGFRAPAHTEIVSHFCDFITEKIDPQLRYSDPDLVQDTSSAKLSDRALSQVQTILQQALSQPEQLSEWFGRYMTEPKYQHPAPETDQEQMQDVLEQEDVLYVNEASRLCWRHQGDELLLFADGECWHLDPVHTDIIDQLCCQREYEIPANPAPELQQLFTEMLHMGTLYR
ncbi:JmjC domain-containing protein [Spongorhabdus nitratireducens]